MTKIKFTKNLEKELKECFLISGEYDIIFNEKSHKERLLADWYLAKLAVKAYKNGFKENGYKLISEFINYELKK